MSPTASPIHRSPPAASRRDGTRAALLTALAVVVAGFAYRALLSFRPSTSISLEVEGWFFEPADTSPLVVLALAGWLTYRRRRRLARLPARPGPWPLSAALLTAGVGGFAWALRANAPDLLVLSLICNVFGAANLVAGLPAVRILAVPGALLLFALPLPAPLLNQVVWRFQIWTADYTGLLLYALGLPALVAGERIIQSHNVFAIIETCSGMRSIETLALLAVLMVDLFRRRGVHALLVIAASPFIAFAINGLRALALMYNPHADINAVHNLQGIVMLLGGVMVLYAFDGVLERVLPRAPPPPAPPAADGEAPAAPLRPRLVLAGGLLGGLAIVSLTLGPGPAPVFGASLPSEVIGRHLDGWRAVDVPTDYLFFGKTGFAQALHRRYTRDGARVDLFLATEPLGRRYRSALSPKTAVPGSGWIVEESGIRERGGREVAESVARRGTSRRLVHHWVEGSDGLAIESLRALLALDAAFARDRIPVVVRLSTPLQGGPEGRRAAAERLVEFRHLLDDSLKKLVTPRARTST